MRTLILLLIIFAAGSLPGQNSISTCQNADYILQKSIEIHDPAQQWKHTPLHLHIQEPRLQVPERYSIIHLDRAGQTFSMDRKRGRRMTTYQLAADGTSRVLLDSSDQYTAADEKTYFLQPNRPASYQDFYSVMYGLPMSLLENDRAEIEGVTTIDFFGQEAFAVSFLLAKPMISKHWRVMVSTENFEMLGLEFFDLQDDTAGEYIRFDGLIQIG
ncbi:MAG: DUF6503 family protein [Bacteroidota bacterium]